MTENFKVASTRSLRPKDFKRKTLKEQLDEADDERFYENALGTLKTGNMKEISVHCGLNKFER